MLTYFVRARHSNYLQNVTVTPFIQDLEVFNINLIIVILVKQIALNFFVSLIAFYYIELKVIYNYLYVDISHIDLQYP